MRWVLLNIVTLEIRTPVHSNCVSKFHQRKSFNPLSTNPTKWPNTLKQFVGKLPTNCLSVFGHFVNLALKGLIYKLVHTSRGNRYLK